MIDIAKAVGVSIATVGRVIHQNGYVSPETRARVELEIARMGYIPNQMARALKGNGSGIIGSLLTSNPNGLCQRINQSIYFATQRHGFELLTMEGQHNRGDEERLVSKFIGMQVNGLVIISNGNVSGSLFERLRNERIPVVAVERGYAAQGVDSLIVKDFQGVHDAVGRIAARGHTRVAFIGMRPQHEVERLRHEGFWAAVRDFGLSGDTGLVRVEDSYGPESGRLAAEQLLGLKEPPTAIFAAADTLAAGAMQILYKHGLRVPQDISIVGYDNVLSEYLSPQIDSVDLSLSDIGETVLSLLNSRMEDLGKEVAVRSVETIYVDRGTVRRLQPE